MPRQYGQRCCSREEKPPTARCRDGCTETAGEAAAALSHARAALPAAVRLAAAECFRDPEPAENEIIGGSGSRLTQGLRAACLRVPERQGRNDYCQADREDLQHGTVPSPAWITADAPPLPINYTMSLATRAAVAASWHSARSERPATTPARSRASRFWLIFALPSSRVIASFRPTMPRASIAR
jgi:hypothetical protein